MKKALELLFYIVAIVVAVVTVFILWFIGILCEKPRR